MSVELQPPELGFRRPFTHEVSQVLRLANHNKDPVAFKVKTTAPKQYCVRPNSGRIEPGGTVEVQVLLQAMKEDPPPDTRCRDKFLVQSVAISAASDVSNVAQVWANIEQTAKSSIQEKKIRVVFLPADGGDAPTNGVYNSLIEEEHPPAYSSPSPTPQRSSVLPPADTSKTAESHTGAVQSTINSATAAVSNVTGYSQEDLKRQLDEAKATISRLQQQATDGLRQRKPTSEPVAGASVQKTNPAQAAPGGVSVQIVALLCFISFLLAYLFF